MQSVRTKAGDTFSFAGQVDLPAGSTWMGRGQIRREDGSPLNDDLGVLDVEISGEEELWVIVSKPASQTVNWPRPANPGEVLIFYFDYEIYDADGDTTVSSETVRVLVEFDPTRA
ncbi:hypothetical protein PY365_04310 [Roseiarcaceae bacterium H3SJ34-1]|uniref:hypothetical protein n=1 Tax=Terripilifer ovatus TaxID=3032367 RepID=UPI003AB9565F|nr:hypothetical protein [Roseiarcaceae bacterium H3SJ34-1]